MARRKGTEPEQFAGLFQKFANIPTRYQLETYESQYAEEDTWDLYCSQILLEKYDSDHMKKTAQKAARSWKSHMEQRNRHHALATPEDANAWCDFLISGDRNQRTCYEHYFIRIYQFYDYLKQSHQHPHLYNPLLLAAIEYEATRQIWEYRIESRPEAVNRE